MDTALPVDDPALRIIPADAGRACRVGAGAHADPQRRLLYIHGGAWTLGSPTRPPPPDRQVFRGGQRRCAGDRLPPDARAPAWPASRTCRAAYRWMLDHGPEGPSPANALFVAGDSAGGNLTLSLIAWIRDQGLRAPNAAVALSPATDGTLQPQPQEQHRDRSDAGAAVQGAGEGAAHRAAVGWLGAEPHAAQPPGGLARLRRPSACRRCWCRPARRKCCSTMPGAMSTRPRQRALRSSFKAGATWCTCGSCSILNCPKGRRPFARLPRSCRPGRRAGAGPYNLMQRRPGAALLQRPACGIQQKTRERVVGM